MASTVDYTDMCAGDSGRGLYQEENNNQADDVTKGLMGCTIGKTACEEDEGPQSEREGYSDEFEDDKTDAEDAEQLSFPTVARSQTHHDVTRPRALDPRETRSLTGSRMLSSLPPAPTTRRQNMSFSNDRLREIERHNHILLNKIVSARKSVRTCAREEARARPAPAAAILRKKAQRQIDHDNLILLKKIQRAKSSSCSMRH